jgi:hypothetical protein
LNFFEVKRPFDLYSTKYAFLHIGHGGRGTKPI